MPPKLGKKEGVIAATAIILGNITAVLTSITNINKFLYEAFGRSFLQALLIIIAVIVLVGYTVGFTAIYQNLFKSTQGLKRTIAILLLILVLGGTIGANLIVLPSPAKAETILRNRVPVWMETILGNQADNGGIRISPMDPGTPTQVWTTAQCLKAILSSGQNLAPHAEKIRRAFQYVESARHLQPEDGWGYWESSDTTVTEVISWVNLANTASLNRDVTNVIWDDAKASQMVNRLERDLTLLGARQQGSGAWAPMADSTGNFTRSYPTVMALWCMVEARQNPLIFKRIGTRFDGSIHNAIVWLLNHYDVSMGLVPNPNRRQYAEPFVGLTAQSLFVLMLTEKQFTFFLQDPNYIAIKKWFTNLDFKSRSVLLNESVPDFDQHFPPSHFQSEGSTFLWFPWSTAVLAALANDKSLDKEDQQKAMELCESTLSKVDELSKNLGSGGMYQVAENLLSASYN